MSNDRPASETKHGWKKGFGLRRRFNQIRSTYPFVFWCSSLLLAFFCIANAFHWLDVLCHGYPPLYYFPQHSFTVIDAETKQPMEGVIAVYNYHGSSMGGRGIWKLKPLLDVAGRGIYAVYLLIANPLLNETIEWNGGEYIAHIAENVSDARGRISFREVGPLIRRRNLYFDECFAPAGYLLKDGYKIEALVKRENLYAPPDPRPCSWRSTPAWSGTVISMHRKITVTLEDEADWAYIIYTQCFKVFDRQKAQELVPHTFEYLSSRKSEFIDEFGLPRMDKMPIIKMQPIKPKQHDQSGRAAGSR